VNAERVNDLVTAMAHSDYTIELASKLKAKAARYRDLAEAIFDSFIVAEIYELVRELESEAASLEQWRQRRAA
jgi:hypothetical protein